MKKPENEKEFIDWLKTNFNIVIDDKYRFYYETVTQKMRNDFEASYFWSKLNSDLIEINDKYLVNKGVHLLIPSNKPKIFIKSLDSVLIKAYRKNILNNTNFPDTPEGGWVLPSNWFSNINDILRTTLTVKYLDGVPFLIEELSLIAKECGLIFDSSFEAREEGYYAAHSGVIQSFSIPNEIFTPMSIELNIEIQVTTQIQEIIKTLLHKHYEQKRKVEKPKDYKWQWDYKCPEFIPNYLGHIVHYVEGMIIEIRDKK